MSNWMSVTARLFVAAIMMSFVGSMVMAAAGPSEPNNARQRARPQGRSMQDRVTQRLNTLTTQLNLNENQQKAVKAILEDEAKQMQALMGTNQSMSREERRAKMQENRGKVEQIRKNTDQRIEQLLTAEQKTKYKKMLEEQAKQRQERQGMRQRQGPQAQHRTGPRGEQGAGGNQGQRQAPAGTEQPADDSGGEQ
jgi:Spy/CpxP family protein refolding chaperone